MATENEKEKRGKKKYLLLLLLLLLIMCVIVTSIVLFMKLSDFIQDDERVVIPLVPSGPTEPSEDGTTVPPTTTDPMNTADPNMEVFDNDVVWSTKTEVEIFKVSYENGQNKIFIESADGDKILAPGASNDYTFWLKNTGNVPLEYEVWVEAYYSDATNAIPIQVKMKDSSGAYQVGSESTWADVMELNTVHDENNLSVNHYDSYTLSWQWLFEGENDEYDTYLGNLNLEEDITLTIKIYTKAAMDLDAAGGQPSTGDTTPIEAAFILLVISGCGVIFLLLLMKKKRDEEDDVRETETR